MKSNLRDTEYLMVLRERRVYNVVHAVCCLITHIRSLDQCISYIYICNLIYIMLVTSVGPLVNPLVCLQQNLGNIGHIEEINLSVKLGGHATHI